MMVAMVMVEEVVSKMYTCTQQQVTGNVHIQYTCTCTVNMGTPHRAWKLNCEIRAPL